eukprot:TRINITY_DN12103_c0_g1_i1.p1 TRINITY_DN12103_c0_g1~~TRINITY_DN12103_c0_g1_i1.p1  ORF type:complete len:515 (+),score=144.38 TRINITY_DN12103_c0_g1_i1:72-1616(+)
MRALARRGVRDYRCAVLVALILVAAVAVLSREGLHSRVSKVRRSARDGEAATAASSAAAASAAAGLWPPAQDRQRNSAHGAMCDAAGPVDNREALKALVSAVAGGVRCRRQHRNGTAVRNGSAHPRANATGGAQQRGLAFGHGAVLSQSGSRGVLRKVASACASATPSRPRVAVAVGDAPWLTDLLSETQRGDDSSTLHVLEPDPWRATAVRKRHATLSDGVRVRVHPVGAGTVEGPFAFWTGPKGSFVKGEGADGRVAHVRVRKVDNLLRDYYSADPPPLTFVAVAAPRSEREALLGSTETLARAAAVVVGDLLPTVDGTRGVVPLLAASGLVPFALGCTGLASLNPNRPHVYGTVLAVRPFLLPAIDQYVCADFSATNLGEGTVVEATVGQVFTRYGAPTATPQLTGWVRALALVILGSAAAAVVWYVGVPVLTGVLGYLLPQYVRSPAAPCAPLTPKARLSPPVLSPRSDCRSDTGRTPVAADGPGVFPGGIGAPAGAAQVSTPRGTRSTF